MNETETPYTDAKAFDSDTGNEVVRADDCRAIERAANAMEAALENLRSRSFCRCLPTIKCAKCRAGVALAAFAALRKEEK